MAYLRSRRDVLHLAALASAVLPASSTALFAQVDDYPSRGVVRSICMLPVGTGADLIVRFYSRKLQALAGQTVIVENKVGAMGRIGMEYAAKSKPDGYTICIAPGATQLAAAPHLYKTMPFDPINDFEHVTTLSALPFLLLVSGDNPHKTVADLVDYLKKQGDKASYGQSGVAATVASELFKTQFGLQAVQVGYKDVASVFQDLWAGNLVFTYFDPPSCLAQIKAGKLRALVTTTKERFKSLPDIPSAAEAGITNMDLVVWWSVHAPKGTPTPILDKLEKWFNEIAVAEDTKQFLSEIGYDPLPGNSQTLKTLLLKDDKAWASYVKIAHIEPVS